jgi:nucleotide-binding universal stress UspA family protein
MPNNKQILVAVDGSESSSRTVNYVADLVGGCPGVRVGLLHLELPPRMLEWGGSEDPEVEEQVSAERAAAYQEMEKSAAQKEKGRLRGLQELLAGRGIVVTPLLVQFEEPLEWKTVADHILKTAAERDCGTIVVGRHSFSGLKRLFKHHVGEELVREDGGRTVWIVE